MERADAHIGIDLHFTAIGIHTASSGSAKDVRLPAVQKRAAPRAGMSAAQSASGASTFRG
jgi:hypothetical protein